MPTRQAKAYSNDILEASGAHTATGNTSAWDGFGDVENLSLLLDITAVSGTTPTLVCLIEHTYDGTTWYQLGSFNAATNITAAGKYVLDIGPRLPNVTPAAVTPASSQAFTRGSVAANFSDTIRVKWVIGGTTPSFTFSVRAISQTPTT